MCFYPSLIMNESQRWVFESVPVVTDQERQVDSVLVTSPSQDTHTIHLHTLALRGNLELF